MLETARIGRSPVHDRFLAESGLSRLDPQDAMTDTLSGITRLSVQFPGEHCTECAAPECHDSCDLFERGCTGRCKRFVDGIVLMPCATELAPCCIEVLFRPWGQLFCVGNAWCVDRDRHRSLTRRLARWGRLSMGLQALFRWLPGRMQWRLTDKIRGAGNRLPRKLNARASQPSVKQATSLLCVVGNPRPDDITVELSVSGIENSQGGRSLRRTSTLHHGWNAVDIPIDEVRQVIDLSALFRIGMVPLIDQPTFLQVLYLGFIVSESASPHPVSRMPYPASPKVKLLVTDLDNTLWDGIVVEDPEGTFPLRPGVRETLEELDRRGILLSICSRNNPEDVQGRLEALGIRELFLHPEITWDPKSEGIRRIVEALNIGTDTVAFIDDSEFERAEVEAALPDVRTFDAVRFADLPEFEDFRVAVTADGSRRRTLYRAEEQRKRTFEHSPEDYDAFLLSCRLVLSLRPYGPGNRDRVLELVQRTNQLNFSGNRYTRESLEQTLVRPGTVPVVMSCSDRFGDYGIIGFAMMTVTPDIVDMVDLMFSCRIQGKKVEHSFLAHVTGEARARGIRELRCRLRETARNRPATRVFDDLGFERELREDHVLVRIELEPGVGAEATWPVTVESEVDLWKSAGGQ